MNYLEIRIAPREYPNIIHIESDQEALALYGALTDAMRLGGVVEVLYNGIRTTIRGDDIRGIALIDSQIMAEQQRREAAERVLYTQAARMGYDSSDKGNAISAPPRSLLH